jgi:hypothetical protein
LGPPARAISVVSQSRSPLTQGIDTLGSGRGKRILKMDELAISEPKLQDRKLDKHARWMPVQFKIL